MKKFDSKKIALAAMSTAISIASVYLSYIVNTLSITFMVTAALCLVILLSQGYLKSAFLCYIATSLLGGLLIGFISALSYILFFGLYTIIGFVINDKVKSKILRIIIKAAFFLAVIYPVVYISKILVGDIFLNFISKSVIHYIGFFIFAELIMFVYDYLIVRIYPVVRSYISRITGRKISDSKPLEKPEDKKTAVSDDNGRNMYDKKDNDDVFKF